MIKAIHIIDISSVTRRRTARGGERSLVTGTARQPVPSSPNHSQIIRAWRLAAPQRTTYRTGKITEFNFRNSCSFSAHTSRNVTRVPMGEART